MFPLFLPIQSEPDNRPRCKCCRQILPTGKEPLYTKLWFMIFVIVLGILIFFSVLGWGFEYSNRETNLTYIQWIGKQLTTLFNLFKHLF